MASLPQAGFPRPFGDYLLLSSFGRGGMGEVFLAKRTAFEGIDRLCVIKTLRAELTGDPEYVNRFLDEARVVVQLHHANISQVFDAGILGADYFMAMEYVSGTNVRDLVNRLHAAGSSLEPGIALFILSETLDALAYAHRLVHPMTGERLNIIHRDVSPHNVMVSFEGEVKLIDFGLAESTLKQEHTESALVLGKVAYMSPEQARGEDVDASCDQFAMAVMAYELLTHERFYGSMKQQQIWQIVGHGGYVPRLLSTLDPEIARLLARAWDPDPSARFPSCEAFREALDDIRAARYPRVGKKQARTLMQGLYQQRILDERKLLLSFAELTSASGQASPSRSSSAVRAHHPASSYLGSSFGGPSPSSDPSSSAATLLDATLSSPTVPSPHPGGREDPARFDGGDGLSTMSLDEQAFVGEKTTTSSSAHSRPATSAGRLRAPGWALGAGLVLVAATGAAGLWLASEEEDAGSTTTVAAPPGPLAEAPAEVAAPVEPLERPNARDIDEPPSVTREAVEPLPGREDRRGGRARTDERRAADRPRLTAPPPPKEQPAAPEVREDPSGPGNAPEAPASPTPANEEKPPASAEPSPPEAPAEKPVVRVVQTAPPSPPDYSGRAALERLQRCELGCAKLWKSKPPDPSLLEENKLPLVYCARKCDGWTLVHRQWVPPK